MSTHSDSHDDHDFGIACVECADDEHRHDDLPWYREPRVVWLAISAVICAAGFIGGLAGLPSLITTFVFAAATLAGAIYPAKAAWSSLLEKTLTINTLLIVAAAGAIYLGLWEEAATMVVVFSLGGVLETFAVDRARNSLRDLVELAPREARIVRDGIETILPVGDVMIGDFMLVKPGDRIPLDGTVRAGVSTVDQSPITGESIPAFKKPGDPVYAGSVNNNGSLEVEVTSKAEDTTLARVIHSVEEHQSKKSSYQRFGERFGAVYTPVMFCVALAVAIIPPVFVEASFADWLYRGLVVLVVSCSCGIALSVPVAIVSAIANAASKGILIKGGVYIELLATVRTVVFDKTGTLTYGEPTVTDIIRFNGVTEDRLLEVAAAVERKSEHPLAEAVVAAAEERDLPRRRVKDFRAITGLGAYGKIGDNVYHAGNRALIEAHGIDLEYVTAAASALETEGKSLVYVSENETLIGLIAVTDIIRKSADTVVAELKKNGVVHTVMLTGDNEGTAAAIAAATSVDEFRAGLLPDQKAEAVMALEAGSGRVAMVGDGINDAPALAAASVGIAMGAAGSGIAIETGDLALMADDLSNLPFAFALSRRAARVIRFNIAAALTLVIILVVLALAGVVQLVPGLIVNEFGAFLIILNGLRLLR